MKANKVYGLLSVLALTAVCASAFAQGGPPRDDQNGVRRQGPGGEGPGGRGMGRRMGPPMEPLFMRPDVQKELKLTDEQIDKLRELMPRPRMGGGPDGGPGQRGQGGQEGRGRRGGPPQDGFDGGQGGERGGPPDGEQGERRRMDGGRGPEQMDEKLSEVLSNGQMKRLKELRLQREGAMALMRRDIAEKIGLSDDERQQLRGKIEEAMESMGRPEQGERPDRKSMEAMHAKLSDQVLRSLSSKQRSKWESLTGKPFKFDENWHPVRRQGGPDGGRPKEGRQRRGEGGPPPPEDDGGNLEAALVMEAMRGQQDAECF